MLTRATEYACLAMLYLAKQPAGKICFTAEIARAERIPTPYLVKVVNLLVKAGLIVSRRGQGGGIELARVADTITLREIVEVTEGEIAFNVCTGSQDYTCFRTGCALRSALHTAQLRYLESLESVTLASFARGDAYPADQPALI